MIDRRGDIFNEENPLTSAQYRISVDKYQNMLNYWYSSLPNQLSIGIASLSQHRVDGLCAVRFLRNYRDIYAEVNLDRFFKHSEKDPLKALRIQQPHLSSEIDNFYFKNCVFIFGDKYHVSENVSHALRWCQDIWSTNFSQVQQLEVYTTPQELSKDGASNLANLLLCAVMSKGLGDLRAFNFCTKQTGISKSFEIDEEHFYTTAIEIQLLSSFCFKLHVRHLTTISCPEITEATSKAFRAYWDMSSRSVHVQNYATWFSSHSTNRVSFLERLPAKIRLLIHKEANRNFYEQDPSTERV